MQNLLEKTHRIVIKLGTGVLRSDDGSIDQDKLSSVAAQVAMLRSRGMEAVIVSSGAVGLGMGKLNLRKRPKPLETQQACAAIGQTILMSAWEKAFEPYNITTAQVLLTHADVQTRKRHVCIHNTMERLLNLGCVPIVNENDTVSVAELKFGDNDMLSALVGSLLKAEMLVILSTAPGLIDMAGTGEILPVVPVIDDSIRGMAGGTDNPAATGGMISKIHAAEVATISGCGVFIGSGEQASILSAMFTGEAIGTYFVPKQSRLDSKKRWIAFFEKSKGSVTVDNGARKALHRGCSLLAKGIKTCDGDFQSGDIVELQSSEGVIFARGRIGFSHDEVVLMAGKGSSEIKRYIDSNSHDEVIHSDNLAILD